MPWARAGQKGKAKYTPAKQRAHMDAIIHLARAARFPLLEGPITLSCAFIYDEDEEGWRSVRPDLDNLVKLVKDALNGVAYVDDSQVAHLRAEKLYGPTAYTSVAVEPLA